MNDVDIKTKLQPTWKNCPKFKDLEADYLESQTAQDLVKAKLLEYEETLAGGKKIKALKNRSTTRPKLAREQAEWAYAAYSEPYLSSTDMFDIIGITPEDVDPARANSLVLNNQWSTKVNKTKLVDDVIHTIVDEGTVIVKTGWESETGVKLVEKEEPVYANPEESIQMMEEAIASGAMSEEQALAMMEMGEPMQKGTQKVYVEEETLVVNQPTYEVCNTANVIIDPTCEGDMTRANFVIHEYDTDYATLKKDEYVENEDGTSYGVYHNINSIELDEDDSYNEHESHNKSTFRFADKPRKKVRAFEYWGYWDIQGDGKLISIVATWVGDSLIRLDENPFPHNRLPFSIATHMVVRKEVHGEPDNHLIKEHQEAIGKAQRAMDDITAKKAIMQEFIDEMLLSPSQKRAYENGNTVYTRQGMDPRKHIYRDTVEPVPPVVYEQIQYHKSAAESITGIRPFASGNTNAATGATGARIATDAVSKREMSTLRRVSAMFLDMARMTIAMNQTFLSEEEYVRITNEEFIKIRRDDLGGNFDFNLEVSTPEKDDDKAEKLFKLMQTNQANMDFELQKIFYGQLLDLWKLPKASKEAKEFEPKPDEGAIQLQQLQIENQRLINEKLKMDMLGEASKIAERDSRAEENSVDIEMKLAKANKDNAQATKIESETDLLDADYIDSTSQGKRNREIEDNEFKSLVEIEKIKAKGEEDRRMKTLQVREDASNMNKAELL